MQTSQLTTTVSPRRRTARKAAKTGSRLSPTEERELVLAARSGGDALEHLIEVYQPLVGSIARLYRGSPSIERCELMQEGVVGLLRALERYDPEMGTPFWAYASWWVRQAMQGLVSELAAPLVLSDRAARQLARIRNAQRELFQARGREPTVRELALATEMTPGLVDSLIAAQRRPRALEEPAGGDDDAGRAILDTIADPSSEQDYERVPDLIDAEQLPSLLVELSDREQVVIRGRYGLDSPTRTLREVGVTLGMSAERVRQIEGEALEKLRQVASTRQPLTRARRPRAFASSRRPSPSCPTGDAA